MNLRESWQQDLDVLCGKHGLAFSPPRLAIQRAGEVLVDALAKRGYLNTQLSFRELFWFPRCAGFSPECWPSA